MIKIRELEDKVFNLTMQYTVAEQKVREATNDDEWGPHGSLMEELSELTNDENQFPEVMGMLLRRIKYERYRWKRVHKALIVLHHLILNGSERVITCCKEHCNDLKNLEIYQHNEDDLDTIRDQRVNIEKKVEDILTLVQDEQRVREERKRAKDNKSKYIGISSPTSGGNMNFDDYNAQEEITDASTFQTMKDSFSRMWSRKFDYSDYLIPGEDVDSEVYADERKLQVSSEGLGDDDDKEDAFDFKQKEKAEQKRNTLESRRGLVYKIDLGKAADLSAFDKTSPQKSIIRSEQKQSDFSDFTDFGDFKSAELSSPMNKSYSRTNPSVEQPHQATSANANSNQFLQNEIEDLMQLGKPTQPQKVHTSHTQPVMQPKQPCMQLRQPVMQPMQPPMQPTQCSMQYNQPVVQSMQPVVQSMQPVVQSMQPVVQAMQPVMQSMHPPLRPLQSTMQSIIRPVMQSPRTTMQSLQPALQSLQPALQSLQPALQSPQTGFPTSALVQNGNMNCNTTHKPNVQPGIFKQPTQVKQPSNISEPSNTRESSLFGNQVSGQSPCTSSSSNGTFDFTNSSTISTVADTASLLNGRNNLNFNLDNFTQNNSKVKNGRPTLNQLVERPFSPQSLPFNQIV